MASAKLFTQWSTLNQIGLGELPGQVPDEEIERVASYARYDEVYWNDPRSYALRVLEGEDPLYIPNARTVVDTTSHYLLKGLSITADEGGKPGSGDVGVELQDAELDTAKGLKAAVKRLLHRELFLSRFHTAKHAGVARGDFVIHMTADPNKIDGRRISLNSVEPGMVFPEYDPEVPDKVVKVDIVDFIFLPEEPTKQRVKKLTYTLEESKTPGGARKVIREEGIYELEPKWFGPEPKLVKQTLPKGPLDDRITAIPVYWFKNLAWEGQLYGSSELRGFESLIRGISQGSTDTQSSLSLEGLGVYATDGGRPVTDTGLETDWEISPGRVMEVPAGSYFRRVEGVSSITPMTDQFNYLEAKIREATALSDVALGRVDVQTAQSGIALAIKFLPTLAKIDERDQSGIGKLRQLFFDWRTWHHVFEGEELKGDIAIEIGEKLPQNRTERLNELNNMLDRGVISKRFYRRELLKLGYEFPPDDVMEKEIEEEKKKEAELQLLLAPPPLVPNAVAAVAGDKPPPPGGGVAQGSQTPKGQNAQGNRSNNRRKPNESGGTEATQTPARQARGARS
jgi:hypothetical protein